MDTIKEIAISIVTNETFNENTLLNLIIANNIEGIKSFIQDIDIAIITNWEIADKNSRTKKALKVAGFEETNQYKQLSSANIDIVEINYRYNELIRKASLAINELQN